MLKIAPTLDPAATSELIFRLAPQEMTVIRHLIVEIFIEVEKLAEKE